MHCEVEAPRLPASITSRLRIPVIAAPMLAVSGPELVVATCRAGAIGAFPAPNARSVEELDSWLRQIDEALADCPDAAPVCPNVVVRSPRAAEDVAVICRYPRAEMVITSVGSPKAVTPILKDAGKIVFADVATMEHARKAAAAGVDGLVLLTAGAGGQTGWMNAFAFVREVRRVFEGPIILAGGVSDGVALRAARVLGCDLAYMGTKFIATRESMASDPYRQLLVEATMDDVVLTKAFNGLLGSYLRQTIVANGLDPAKLDEQISEQVAKLRFGTGASGPQRWKDLWSAGHSVSGVREILSVAELIEQTAREYETGRVSEPSAFA